MSTTPRILLVDDEPAIIVPLADMLEQEGYEVATARDGLDALDQVEKLSPHLIVLDVRMPRMGGREVLRRLRQDGNWTAVILLTQIDDPVRQVAALNEGADDYITKPYDPHELLARIRVALRRAGLHTAIPASVDLVVSDRLLLDRRSHQVFLDGRPVKLTPKAIALLDYLMRHPGEVFTREQLLDAIWGWAKGGGTRVVDVRIAELRQKLGDDAVHPRYITTILSAGYSFTAPVEAGR